MTTKETIAIWGCSVSANVWIASSNQPLGYLWAVLWLIFGALICYASSRAPKPESTP